MLPTLLLANQWIKRPDKKRARSPAMSSLVVGWPNTVNAGVERARIPAYPAPDGWVKLSAAWLIEWAGFAGEYIGGNAGISSRHAVALINRGGTPATEVLSLQDEINRTIACHFGIALESKPMWLVA